MTTVTGALLAGRRAAERLMTSTAVVDRVTGRVLDQNTAEYTDTYSPVYSGRCRVQTPDALPHTPEAGGREWTLNRFELHVPASTQPGTFKPGDRVTVGSVVGKVVSERPAKTHETKRVVFCEVQS